MCSSYVSKDHRAFIFRVNWKTELSTDRTYSEEVIWWQNGLTTISCL